jgi:ATP-binding cassette subfamily F protein 3
VLHISAGNLTPYAGDYNYYLEKSGALDARKALVAGEQLTDSRPAEAPVKVEAKSGGSAGKSKEQKRKEAEERQAVSAARRKTQARVAEIEKQIAALEARHKEIVTLMESPDTYANGDVVRLNRELLENTERQEALNEEWADASADVAALNS